MRTIVLSISLLLVCRQLVPAQVSGTLSSSAVADRIIAAVNERNLDKVMSFVDDDVTVRGGIGADAPMLLSGKAKFREAMSTFLQKVPQSRVRSATRITQQEFVIDQLIATGLPGGAAEDGVIIYEITLGKVVKVWVLPKRVVRSTPQDE